MEILQTIWTILITESELGVKIITIPLAVIEAILTTLLFTSILNIKSSYKQKSLYVLIFSFIGTISLFFFKTPFNTFINVLACPILVYFIFKTNIINSILAEIIPYIFFVILSSLLITFCVRITDLPSNYFFQIPLYKLCFSLIMYLIVYLFYLLFNRFNINITLLDKMKKRINFIIFINFIIRYNCYSTSILYFYSSY